ncbi:MAG: multidrug resistance operon repressor MexR [Puniceicoccaceae bacterium 5H]|nr:MAG: multidrug resistance operon repressor MexR [Puniceicoccaceae bacterium 5H]
MPVDPHLPLALGQIVRRFRAEWTARLAQHDSHHSPAHYHALSFLAENPGAHLQGIVEYVGLDKGNVTRLVKELATQGLVERQADPEDRRCACLQLTAAGRRVLDELQALKDAANERLFGPLDEAEQRQLSQLLRKALSGQPE